MPDKEQATLPPPLAAPGGPAFVGREEELGRLAAVLERAHEGRRQICFVAGEPGVGKTRLVAEAAARARDDGWRVLYGHAPEARVVPFRPFVEALSAWVGEADDEELEAAMDEPLAGELVRLLPELARRVAGPAGRPAADPETARFRMFDAIASLLFGLCRRAPLLLVLDDLHCADTASLFLLGHILRSPEEGPLAVLCTYRESELPAGSPLGPLLSDAAAESLPLIGLAEREVGLLIRDSSGSEPAPQLSSAIYQETEGNPLFVQELLRHLRDSGALRERAGRVELAVPIAEAGVPERVREVIARRLTRLSDMTRRVLSTAAVLGPQFPLELLGEAAGFSREELATALDEGFAAGVLTGRDDGGPRFAHALLREVVYREVPGVRRGQLHLRAAQAMERLYPGELDERAGEVADHLIRAGPAAEPARALEYAVRAARRANEQLAYEEAARRYGQALAALPPEASPLEHCDLLLELGETEARAGETERSRATCMRAAELARRLGDAGRLAAAAIGSASRFVVQPGIVDEAMIGLLQEALEATRGQHSVARVRLLGQLCGALYYSDRRERIGELSREALDISDRLGDAAARAYACSARHRALWRPERARERLAAATDLVRYAERAGERDLALEGNGWLLVDLLELGDIEAVESQLELFERGAEELRQPLYRWNAAVFRAMRAILSGDFEAGESLAREALDIGQQAESLTAPHYFATQILVIRREQGRLHELEAVAEEFVERFPALPAWRGALALVYLEVGREDDARRELERIVRRGEAQLPRDANWLIGVTLLSEVSAGLRDPERAATLYELLLPYRRSAIVVGLAAVCLGSAARNLGVLADAMGRRAEAEQHFRLALEMNEALTAEPWLAHTRHDYARMLQARGAPGDAERAQQLLEQARAAAERLGMRRLSPGSALPR